MYADAVLATVLQVSSNTDVLAGMTKSSDSLVVCGCLLIHASLGIVCERERES